MMLASVSWRQGETINDCSPVQYIEIDMMQASVSWRQCETINDCSPVQYIEIDMMPASVSLSQFANPISVVQCNA